MDATHWHDLISIFGEVMDSIEHVETAGGGILDAGHIALASEGRRVEPFKLDRRMPTDDGFERDLRRMDDEWPGSLGAQSELRRSQDELRQLSVKLLSVQESERQRIAADLHDGLGQALSLIKLSLERAAQLLSAGKEEDAADVLQQTIDRAKDAMAELRRTTADLRPPMLDDLGIIPTVTWFLREFELASRDTQVERDLQIAESDVPVALKATIFRILQEAMNNVMKHARAGSVRVCLKNSGVLLQLSIEDNGQGFDRAGLLTRRPSERCIGLLTMKERARSSDGVFEIHSACGQGTTILVTWRARGGKDDQRDDAITRVGRI